MLLLYSDAICVKRWELHPSVAMCMLFACRISLLRLLRPCNIHASECIQAPNRSVVAPTTNVHLRQDTVMTLPPASPDPNSLSQCFYWIAGATSCVAVHVIIIQAVECGRIRQLSTTLSPTQRLSWHLLDDLILAM